MSDPPDTDYSSPRWSHEFVDCSMPMTFDTYSQCSAACQYCFSNFQREIGLAGRQFRKRLRSVNVDKVKALFTAPGDNQFAPYIQQRIPMQWGGLSDPFDHFERKYGVTLELLRFFREIEYPISFCTKFTWWAEDERYVSLLGGFPGFNLKVSIITPDNAAAARVEPGADTPAARMALIERASQFMAGGVTLRLRPFIIGITDRDDGHVRLIQAAAQAGATAVSTEFLCLENRSPQGVAQRYPRISAVAGFDLLAFYREHSVTSGYLRLNRNVKRPYVDAMEAAARAAGLRFYVSDAHFKERCANGSCCGLSPDWNYYRGQFTEALQIAKRNGSVRWSDIALGTVTMAEVPWGRAEGYNTGGSEKRAAFHGQSMIDVLRYWWNHPKDAQSPYKMFEGVLQPDSLDSEGNIIYVYDATRS